MYLDRDDIKRFRGIFKENGAGKSLEQFLEEYDPKAYDNPSHTVDTVVFGTVGGEIRSVMLIFRGNHPCIGMPALPGGFVEYKENLKDAALRELREETGIDNIDAVQLKTYGDWDRDPRTRIITTVFASVVEKDKIDFAAGDDAANADWFDIDLKEKEGGRYDLLLTGNNLRAAFSAELVHEYTEIGAVRDHKFRQLSSQMAADHACLLVESYLRMTGGI